MYVPGAYLHVPIEETIYLRLPKEISDRYILKHPHFKKISRFQRYSHRQAQQISLRLETVWTKV